MMRADAPEFRPSGSVAMTNLVSATGGELYPPGNPGALRYHPPSVSRPPMEWEAVEQSFEGNRLSVPLAEEAYQLSPSPFQQEESYYYLPDGLDLSPPALSSGEAYRLDVPELPITPPGTITNTQHYGFGDYPVEDHHLAYQAHLRSKGHRHGTTVDQHMLLEKKDHGIAEQVQAQYLSERSNFSTPSGRPNTYITESLLCRHQMRHNKRPVRNQSQALDGAAKPRRDKSQTWSAHVNRSPGPSAALLKMRAKKNQIVPPSPTGSQLSVSQKSTCSRASSKKQTKGNQSRKQKRGDGSKNKGRNRKRDAHQEFSSNLRGGMKTNSGCGMKTNSGQTRLSGSHSYRAQKNNDRRKDRKWQSVNRAGKFRRRTSRVTPKMKTKFNSVLPSSPYAVLAVRCPVMSNNSHSEGTSTSPEAEIGKMASPKTPTPVKRKPVKTARPKPIPMKKNKSVRTKKSRKEQKRATTPPAQAMAVLHASPKVTDHNEVTSQRTQEAIPSMAELALPEVKPLLVKEEIREIKEHNAPKPKRSSPKLQPGLDILSKELNLLRQRIETLSRAGNRREFGHPIQEQTPVPPFELEPVIFPVDQTPPVQLIYRFLVVAINFALRCFFSLVVGILSTLAPVLARLLPLLYWLWTNILLRAARITFLICYRALKNWKQSWTFIYIYVFPFLSQEIGHYVEPPIAGTALWYLYLLQDLMGSPEAAAPFQIIFKYFVTCGLVLLSQLSTSSKYVALPLILNAGERLVMAYLLVALKSDHFFARRFLLGFGHLVLMAVWFGDNIFVQVIVLMVALYNLDKEENPELGAENIPRQAVATEGETA